MNLSMLHKCNSLADIGCDHAYTAIYATSNGLCDTCFACDIRKGPLEIAAKNISQAGLSDKITTVLCDGLEGLEPGSVDAILISGMGGLTITHVLNIGAKVVGEANQLILQPQSEASAVRHLVEEMGFFIEDEKCVVEEGKFYTCISCVKGKKESYSEEFMYHYGKVLLDRKDAELHKWLVDKFTKLTSIYNACKDKGTENNLDNLRIELEMIRGALEYIER